MRPAVVFGAVSTVFCAGFGLAAIALIRVLDPALAVHSSGESAGWTFAYAALFSASAYVWSLASRVAAAERAYTGRLVACQAQRNALSAAVALTLVALAGLVLAVLSWAKVVRLQDWLTVAATLNGPVAAIWYWASTLPYSPLQRGKTL